MAFSGVMVLDTDAMALEDLAVFKKDCADHGIVLVTKRPGTMIEFYPQYHCWIATASLKPHPNEVVTTWNATLGFHLGQWDERGQRWLCERGNIMAVPDFWQPLPVPPFHTRVL